VTRPVIDQTGDALRQPFGSIAIQPLTGRTHLARHDIELDGFGDTIDWLNHSGLDHPSDSRSRMLKAILQAGGRVEVPQHGDFLCA